MLELRVLGRQDLRDARGGERRKVMAQPKRLALLVYLAVRPIPDFHRRDTLLGLFWPEMSESQARAALRSALHFLRQALGADVVVSRGTEEVGVDPDLLRCDAAEFRRLLKDDDPREAVELYRGDLLEGFFLSGAPGWEDWLHLERSKLRARAREAAWLVSERIESAGHAALAAHYARRATELNPDHGPSLRRRMGLLARLGDRAGAIRIYREFAARLERKFDLEPDAETSRLAERIARGEATADLAGSEGPATDPPPKGRDEATDPDPAEAVDPPASGTPVGTEASGVDAAGDGRTGRWKTWIVSPVLLAVVIVSAAAGLWLSGDSGTAASPSTVAVFPFTYHGGSDWEYAGEAVATLLGTALDGEVGLRTVDARALHAVLAQESSDPWSPESGPAVAARLGAGAYVLGQVVESDDRLRVTATLYGTVGGGSDGGRPVDGTEEVLGEVTIEGDGESMFELVDGLTAQLLARSGVTRQLDSIAARTTASPEALLAFVEGEHELREGRPERAAGAFQRAVEADSTFALAYYGLSRAAHWLTHAQFTDEGAEGAVRHAHGLGRVDRTLVLAWDRYRRGDAVAADSLYRLVLRERPDDVEAWLNLGELGFHFGPMLGRPARESREVFERVLRYEPDNVSALFHLARLAARGGELGRLDSLVVRVRDLGADAYQSMLLSVLRSHAHDEPEMSAELQAEVERAPFLQQQFTTLAVVADAGKLPRATRFARGVAERQADPLDRAWANLMVAQVELARGRWSVARATMNRVEREVPDWAAELRAAFLTVPFLEVSDAELAEAYDALLQAPGEVQSFRPNGFEQRRHYLLGMLALRLGDREALQEAQTALEGYVGATEPRDSAFSRRLTSNLRAHLLAQDGDTARALSLLGPPRPQPDQARPALTSYYMANERWLRAELLRSSGRDEEAMRVYATFPDPDAYDLIYLAPSHSRRAEIYEANGDPDRAAEHHRRFLELWDAAEPPLLGFAVAPVSSGWRSSRALREPGSGSSPGPRPEPGPSPSLHP